MEGRKPLVGGIKLEYKSTNVHLLKEQLEWLQKHVMERKLKGEKVTQSEVIREALEIYKSKEESK